jgi:hypothetical protein
MNHVIYITIILVMGVVFKTTLSRVEGSVKHLESILDIAQKNQSMRKEIVSSLSNKYERCLSKNKRYESLWRRKIKGYTKIAKLTKKRWEKWQRKEKPLILAHFFPPFKKWVGLETSTTPYRLEYLTYLEPMEESSTGLR